MNADRPNDIPYGSNPGGAPEPQHPLERVLDVIARNEKDEPTSGGAIQRANTSRPSEAALAVRSTIGPEQPWAGAAAANRDQSSGATLSSILRYKWTLFLVTMLVSAPITALVWTQVVPKYRARGEVRVRPMIPVVVFRTDENGNIPFYNSFVNTQVSLIRGLTVLQRVLDRDEIQSTQWYAEMPRTALGRLMRDKRPHIERLRDSLSASPRRGTEIIDVAFTDASATEAKLIVQCVLNEYLRYTRESINSEEESLYQELVAQYDSLQREIEGREKVCAELRKALQTQTPEELISAKRVRLVEMESRLSEFQNRIALIEWEISQVSVPEDANGAPVVVEMTQPQYYLDEEWSRLERNVKSLQHQIDASIKGPTHPDIIRLEKDLAFAQSLLSERGDQLDEQWRHRVAVTEATPGGEHVDPIQVKLASLNSQLARTRQEQQLVLGEYNTEKEAFKSLFDRAQMLAKELSALQHQRDLFSTVRQRLDQKKIERSANVPGSVEILMDAFAPSKPSEDRRIVFTAMALCCGLGLGGGAAFLRASRDKTICNLKDMPQAAQTPFLGQVPVVRTTKPLGKSLCDEIEQNQFMLVESIRVLRTTLLSRLKNIDHDKAVTVLITSAGEGTGKSSFTMMLGKSIAQAGKKVLLIDTDFHRTTLSRRFELLDKKGLVDVLAHKSDNGLPVFPTKTPGLDVMPAGIREGTQHPVFEEIANGAFKSCISRIRKEHDYDIVLLDSSPVLPVADATILAGQVDGTIMVEREHVSQRPHVMNAVARLGSAGGRLLGTVFVGSFTQDHYGYGYGYGYGKKSV